MTDVCDAVEGPAVQWPQIQGLGAGAALQHTSSLAMRWDNMPLPLFHSPLVFWTPCPKGQQPLPPARPHIRGLACLLPFSEVGYLNACPVGHSCARLLGCLSQACVCSERSLILPCHDWKGKSAVKISARKKAVFITPKATLCGSPLLPIGDVPSRHLPGTLEIGYVHEAKECGTGGWQTESLPQQNPDLCTTPFLDSWECV